MYGKQTLARNLNYLSTHPLPPPPVPEPPPELELLRPRLVFSESLRSSDGTFVVVAEGVATLPSSTVNGSLTVTGSVINNTLEERLEGIEARITAAEDTSAAHDAEQDAELSALSSKNTQQDAALSSLSTRVGATESKNTQQDAALSSLSTRVGTVEATAVQALQIGTVVSGLEGSSAAASVAQIAGTQTWALSLSIPRGDKGVQGDKGDRGGKGDDGAKGDKGSKGDQGDPGDASAAIAAAAAAGASAGVAAASAAAAATSAAASAASAGAAAAAAASAEAQATETAQKTALQSCNLIGGKTSWTGSLALNDGLFDRFRVDQYGAVDADGGVHSKGDVKSDGEVRGNTLRASTVYTSTLDAASESGTIQFTNSGGTVFAADISVAAPHAVVAQTFRAPQFTADGVSSSVLQLVGDVVEVHGEITAPLIQPEDLLEPPHGALRISAQDEVAITSASVTITAPTIECDGDIYAPKVTTSTIITDGIAAAQYTLQVESAGSIRLTAPNVQIYGNLTVFGSMNTGINTSSGEIFTGFAQW